MKRCICLLMLATILPLAPQTANAENTVKPELGISLVISPGYNDALTDAYDSVSGGYGWMGLHLGVAIKPMEQVRITPRIGLLFNFVLSVGNDDSFANSIVQPALAGRFLFSKGSSFYLEGEVSHNTVSTGSDRFDTDGGIGYAAIVGYEWANGIDLGVGYSFIPTDVTFENGTDEKNFGGIELRFRGTF